MSQGVIISKVNKLLTQGRDRSTKMTITVGATPVQHSVEKTKRPTQKGVGEIGPYTNSAMEDLGVKLLHIAPV